MQSGNETSIMLMGHFPVKNENLSVYLWHILSGCQCVVVVAQWQSTGRSSQRCPGFDSRPHKFTSLIIWLALFRVSSTNVDVR